MHPRKKRPPGPSSRDLGLESRQAGKGGRPRNCFSEDFRENLDGALANSKPAEGFISTGPGRQVKVYDKQPHPTRYDYE